MNPHLHELALELSSREAATSIRFSDGGNSWLPYPFLGVTRPNGDRFALYFQGGQLFFVPAFSGTVRPQITVSFEDEDWDVRAVVERIQRLEEQSNRSKNTEQPSFSISNGSSRKTSESVHKLRYNWLLPVLSGGFIFLAVILVSIGTTTAPPATTGINQPNNGFPTIDSTLEPTRVPSFPSQTSPGGTREFGTLDSSPGYMVTCNDGTVSYSGGKRGACSWHGGVR